jgi:transcriptional antiterminator RfaH
MRLWYALHTKPFTERKVAAHLERSHVETFLPLTTEKRRSADGCLVPFFPGYLFIRVDLQTTRSLSWLVPGAVYLVGYGDEPIPIPDEVIRLINRQLTLLASRNGRNARFKQGDPVRITEGPFRDMVGIFDDDCEPSERVHVLLDAMCRSLRLRLPVTALERAELHEGTSLPRPPRRTRGRGRPIRS